MTPEGPPSAAPRRGRVAVAMLGGAVVVAAVAGAGLGADRARQPIESRKVARESILKAIEVGSRDPEVRDALLRLRGTLGRRPLDAYTRAVYATFLLGVSRGPEDARVAAFHARRAARLAPVTVPVLRYAVQVLVRTGDPGEAVAILREMFRYDADAAASLLSEVESLLPPGDFIEALPDDTHAWVAWWSRLRELGRQDEADTVLALARRRWPDDLALLQRAAARAHRADRWDELRALLPGDGDLPAEPEASRLLCYRARVKAEDGDAPGARRDVEAALDLAGNEVTTLTLAAEVLEAIGDPEPARRHWTRALFLLSGSRDTARRVGIMVRLARLEEREGSAASALRIWRSILEIDAGHAEARRRGDELAGFPR